MTNRYARIVRAARALSTFMRVFHTYMLMPRGLCVRYA